MLRSIWSSYHLWQRYVFCWKTGRLLRPSSTVKESCNKQSYIRGHSVWNLHATRSRLVSWISYKMTTHVKSSMYDSWNSLIRKKNHLKFFMFYAFYNAIVYSWFHTAEMLKMPRLCLKWKTERLTLEKKEETKEHSRSSALKSHFY